jgi:hypothetical protein
MMLRIAVASIGFALIVSCSQKSERTSRATTENFFKPYLLLIHSYVDSMEQVLDKSINIVKSDISDTSAVRVTYQMKAVIYFCVVRELTDEINRMAAARKLTQNEMDNTIDEMRLMFKRVGDKTSELEKLGFKFHYRCDSHAPLVGARLQPR